MTRGTDRRVHATHRHAVVPLDARADQSRTVIGAKGHGLAEMVRTGLPVPPAFCISAEWCEHCSQTPGALVDQLWPDVLAGLTWLEGETSRTFGRGPRPLVLAVRSSGVTSMPGMLETVLDVGIDDAVRDALARTYSAEFARDTAARLHRGFRRATHDGADLPREPLQQLRAAIEAVLASWSSSRTSTYRAHRDLPPQTGVAVLVQAMVFGNLDDRSGTGVLFSRHPATGAPEPFGEWLAAGQGDDVVSGAVDAEPLDGLRARMPDVYDELIAAGRLLERLHGDAQDVEFTVEGGRLWLLQARVAQRSAQAVLRLALALHDDGVIDDAELIARVTPAHLAAATSAPARDRELAAAPLLASGLPASPGVASGVVCTTSDDAIDAAELGRDVILVRPTTSPDDVAGMLAARGVVTEAGGATSHAAIVARELGLPAVVGCGSGLGDLLGGRVVTVDGDAGEVRAGAFTPGARSAPDPRRPDADLERFAEVVRRSSPLRAHSGAGHPTLTDASDAAVGAALASGLRDVVSDEPLRVMLVAARLAHRR